MPQSLDRLGDPVDELPSHRKGKLLLTLITDYAQLFTGVVNGTPGATLANANASQALMGRGGVGATGGYTWVDGKYTRADAGGGKVGGLEDAGRGGRAGAQRSASKWGASDGGAVGEEITGGARINFILEDLFVDTLRQVR